MKVKLIIENQRVDAEDGRVFERCNPVDGALVTTAPSAGVADAMRVANDTDYGLAAAVFGADVTRALDVAKRIDAGHVHVNGATVQNEPQAPYGGMKSSGYRRFDGRAVIDEFTELKWITIEPSGQRYPI